MTPEEFLKILEAHKALISEENFQKLSAKAKTMDPLGLALIAQRLQNAGSQVKKIHAAGDMLATVFQEETAVLQAKQKTLSSQISIFSNTK